jgi:hypothetical protein
MLQQIEQERQQVIADSKALSEAYELILKKEVNVRRPQEIKGGSGSISFQFPNDRPQPIWIKGQFVGHNIDIPGFALQLNRKLVSLDSRLYKLVTDEVESRAIVDERVAKLYKETSALKSETEKRIQACQDWEKQLQVREAEVSESKWKTSRKLDEVRVRDEEWNERQDELCAEYVLSRMWTWILAVVGIAGILYIPIDAPYGWFAWYGSVSMTFGAIMLVMACIIVRFKKVIYVEPSSR